MSLTQQQLNGLADKLRGTCTTISEAIERLGISELDALDAEDLLLDVNCEQCQHCGWWFECHELNEGRGCDDCAAPPAGEGV